MDIPTTYTAYLITDAGETKLIESVWKSAAIDAADKAIVGRIDARTVVVTFNFTTLCDDVCYERSTHPAATALPTPTAPATEILRSAAVYAFYVDGVWIGDAPTYADGDTMLNQWLFDRAMLAVECGLELAQDTAAGLARRTHGGAHVVRDGGGYVVCGDADVGDWRLEQVVWSCEPEQVYFTDELICESL